MNVFPPMSLNIDERFSPFLGYQVATASPAMEMGHSDALERCEQLVADFVGKEAAMVIGMYERDYTYNMLLIIISIWLY